MTIKESARKCGSCTKCCEGWLYGKAYEKPFWRGRPCHYLADGKCSIYGNHPDDPCKSFKCEWLSNKDVPGWLKPNEVNAILSMREKKGFKYLRITEAGGILRSDVLSWAYMYCLQNKLNLEYTIDSGSNRIGNPEFLAAMDE